jgi:hypothetical protein
MMRLDVHITPRQYRDGFADRIALLLFKGAFSAMRGRWRARRQLVVFDCRPLVGDIRQRHPTLQQITFDLEPLDDVADAVVKQQVR